MKEISERKSIVYVFLCYVSWGVLPLFWKILNKLDALYILSSRIIWATIFCLVLVLINGKWEEVKSVLKDKGQRKLLFVAGIMLGINWGVYIYAVNSNHVLEGSLAYYMNPLLAIGIGFFVFHEKLKISQWVSMAIAFIGIFVSIIGYGKIPYLAVLIGASFAVYGAVKKGIRCSSLVSNLLEGMVLFPLALVYIIFSEVHGNGAMGQLVSAEFLLLPMTGIVTAIPLLLFSTGIKKVSMSLSGILMYVNPTLQLIIGVFIFHEKLETPTLIMFSCVWVALVVFVQSAGRGRSRS